MHAPLWSLLCFDLDGCLVDSTAAIPRCINLALTELGLPEQPETSLLWCIGPPLMESLRVLLVEAGADPGQAPLAVAAYRRHYRRISLEATTVFAGIPAAVEALATPSTLVVVTSKPRVLAVPILEAVGLSPYVRAVHGPDLDSEETKTVTLQRAIEHHAATPERCVMVGDRRHDIDAGRACGTRTVGVTWGAGSRRELERARADVVVDAPSDLPAVVTARLGG